MGAVFSSHQEYERLPTDDKTRIEHKVVEGKHNDEESQHDPSLATSNSANNQEISCSVHILNNSTTNDVLCRICLEEINKTKGPLLKLPCDCSRGNVHVHKLCIQWYWGRLAVQDRYTCEVCMCDLDSFVGDMLLTPNDKLFLSNLTQQTHQHVIEVPEDEAMQHLEGAHMVTSKLLIAFILGFTLIVLLVALLLHKELGVES